MSGSGVLFAVEKDEINKLKNMRFSERPEYISSELEEIYFEEYPERTCELDVSWDAMHRALTDGSLCFDVGQNTAGLAILGGEELYYDGEDHDDYIISAKTPDQVKSIYNVLSGISDAEFKRGYKKIDPEEYPSKDNEDMEYTLEYFRDSIAFWRFAAEHGYWVLFTADQ